MSNVMSRDELKQLIQESEGLGHTELHTYKDIFSNRYINGLDLSNWIIEGADYDKLYGGDWMPLSNIAFYKILEEALYGTYWGEPV